MSDNKLEEDFEEIRKQVAAKMQEASKLIREAEELARKELHTSLSGADYSAFVDLQGVMEDTGFVTEREWNSSNCW